jgi:acetyltransferase-like isoleucine patch superfamily enzyme
MKLITYFSLLNNFISNIFSKNSIFSFSIKSSNSKKSSLGALSRVYNSKIDDYTYIGRNCLIQKTVIGKFCSISDYCFIGLPNHPVDWVSTSPVFIHGKNKLKINFSNFKYESMLETTIENDVWIGINVIIKSGLKIGQGSIVGAGSVVTKNVEPYSIVAGNPAKLIKYRFDKETIQALLSINWFDWSSDEIKEASIYFKEPKQLIDNTRNGEKNK